MRLILDRETDQLYIHLTEKPSVESQELYPGIVADFDENQEICGFDIENASKFDLTKFSIDLLPDTNKKTTNLPSSSTK